MATIDLTNFDSNTLGLVQCTGGGRAGTPNGNVFFDVANGLVEIITVEELANVNMTARSGGASVTNPLSAQDGVKLEALYAFEREQRKADEVLRQYDYYFKGTFKFGGAYEIVNNRKFAVDTVLGAPGGVHGDREKIRGSGWIERNAAQAVGRIYYGNVSLGNIEPASAPYYQLTAGGAPTPYAKLGPIDEAIQVVGVTAIDATSVLNSDLSAYEALSVRTYGQNYDRKVLADSGVSKMDGYSSGFAIAEGVHLTTNTGDHPLASVYNAIPASQTGVWLNMTLEELDVAQTETGFTTGAAEPFTWVLNNPGAASLDQCIAYLDAIAQTDDDINAHGTNVVNGQRVGTWYTYNAAGKILPRTNVASEGLFIEGLLGSDKNRVVFTDDADVTREYPNYTTVSVNIGAGAVGDANAWFHSFWLNGDAADDFNSTGAVTTTTPAPLDVKGDVSGHAFLSGNNIVFEQDYASLPTVKDIVFECEGDGGVTAAKTVISVPASGTIAASCVPPAETNV